MKKVKKVAKTTKTKSHTKSVKRTQTKHLHGTFYGLEHDFVIITGGSFIIVAIMFMLFS